MDITILELIQEGGAVGVAAFMAWWAWNERKWGIKQAERFLDAIEEHTAAMVQLEKKIDVEQTLKSIQSQS